MKNPGGKGRRTQTFSLVGSEALVSGFASSGAALDGNSPFFRPENMVHQTISTNITL
jgi:hypothetical protein